MGKTAFEIAKSILAETRERKQQQLEKERKEQEHRNSLLAEIDKLLEPFAELDGVEVDIARKMITVNRCSYVIRLRGGFEWYELYEGEERGTPAGEANSVEELNQRFGKFIGNLLK